jgi:predicted GIY-YIG superfamily endonuclease
MENIILVKIGTDPDFEATPDNIFVKNCNDGKLYIGNNTNVMDEIKTDKSNNWAKMFLYGGN